MIYKHIQGLVQQAIATKLIDELDQIYARNQIFALLKLESFSESVQDPTKNSIPILLDLIIDDAVKYNVIEDVFYDKEFLSAIIMNCFLARPSVINRTFWV